MFYRECKRGEATLNIKLPLNKGNGINEDGVIKKSRGFLNAG